MKNKAKKERLVVLMAKGFLGFTAAVLIVSFFTIWLSNAYYAQISRVPDMEGLRENQNLLHENYECLHILL